MIDINLPLELDDGTAVTLVKMSNAHEALVQLPKGKSYSRNGGGTLGSTWHYDIKNGRWVGDIVNRCFTLRNIKEKNMIDINLPLELDDGTPVEYVKHRGKYVAVRIPQEAHYRRNRRGESNHRVWDYNIKDGIWAGGNAETYLTLRNAKEKNMVDFNKPLVVGGREAKVIHTFADGTVAVVVEGWGQVQHYSPANNFGGLTNKVVEKVDYINLYLGDSTKSTFYAYNHQTEEAARKGAAPAGGGDKNVQGTVTIKRTFRDGKLVNSEIIAQ